MYRIHTQGALIELDHSRLGFSSSTFRNNNVTVSSDDDMTYTYIQTLTRTDGRSYSQTAGASAMAMNDDQDINTAVIKALNGSYVLGRRSLFKANQNTRNLLARDSDLRLDDTVFTTATLSSSAEASSSLGSVVRLIGDSTLVANNAYIDKVG